MNNRGQNPNPRAFFPENNQGRPEAIPIQSTDPEMTCEPNQNNNQGFTESEIVSDPPIFPAIPVTTATRLLPETTLKLPDAVRFDGSPANYQAFMSSMSLYFWARPEVFNEERNRIVYIGAHLSGPASVWFGNLISDNSQTIQSFPLFVQEFSRNFSDPSSGIRARGQIRKLRQGARSVAAYAADFRTLARDSGYDQLALVDQFLRGLNDNVMNFMIMSDLPENLESNIDIALRIDNRLSSRNMLRQDHPDFSSHAYRRPYSVPQASTASNMQFPQTHTTNQASTSSNSGHSPMEIDAITSRFRPPLSTEEKQRRRELGLCLYCGQPGHIIPDCPLKSASGKGRSQ
ncbi:Retrotransposon-like protein 1 [Smittium mucronatum]|uniref:Retrotransposon-like protein 1 n=1 Tax=Smittium mucronatum TaxID=133383 RepID=A0A1R0GZ55_9FUNG|nr:Retrotransposon-like protein 1 [Smittium mucronatum]